MSITNTYMQNICTHMHNLNPLFLVSPEPHSLLFPLPVTWCYIPTFFIFDFSNKLKQSRYKEVERSWTLFWPFWGQSLSFHSFHPNSKFFILFLDPSLYTSIQQFKKKITQVQCMHVGFGWAVEIDFRVNLFLSCVSRLSGLSAPGLSFTGGE